MLTTIIVAVAIVIALLVFMRLSRRPARRRSTNHKHIPACYDQPPAEHKE